MTCYLGEIRVFAGNFAPVDWAVCDGKLLKISEFQQLFSLLGTSFGGDGITTFGLPDLRGRILVNRGTSATGSVYPFGASGGQEKVTLSAANLPAHTHAFNVVKKQALTNVPDNNAIAEADDTNAATDMAIYLPATAADAKAYPLHSNAIGNNITPNLPHENRMPHMILNYIICISRGLYPDF